MDAVIALFAKNPALALALILMLMHSHHQLCADQLKQRLADLEAVVAQINGLFDGTKPPR